MTVSLNGSAWLRRRVTNANERLALADAKPCACGVAPDLQRILFWSGRLVVCHECERGIGVPGGSARDAVAAWNEVTP